MLSGLHFRAAAPTLFNPLVLLRNAAKKNIANNVHHQTINTAGYSDIPWQNARRRLVDAWYALMSGTCGYFVLLLNFAAMASEQRRIGFTCAVCQRLADYLVLLGQDKLNVNCTDRLLWP